jgi:hypothetical protein
LKNLANEASIRASREVIAKQKRKETRNNTNRHPVNVEDMESRISELNNNEVQNHELPLIEERHIQEAFLTMYDSSSLDDSSI